MDSAANHPVSAGVTAMIFTLNEEIHLPSCLASLAWCDDVIVVDSYSTDRTEELCRSAGARFFQRAFDGFGKQRTWAIRNTMPRHDWILVLDADERVPPELARELAYAARMPDKGVGAWRLRRRFFMFGRWLRFSGLYPTWVVRLVHKDRVHYVNRGHAETQEVDGPVRQLRNDLIDENLKGLGEWFERQNRYSTEDARYELSLESRPLQMLEVLASDPLMRRAALKRVAAALPGRPLVYFIYAYVLRGGFLEGTHGLMYCTMRAMYQAMVVMKKYELRGKAGAP